MKKKFCGLYNYCKLHLTTQINNLCNAIQKFTKDKAGIGGLLLLHRFASLLPTPSRTFFIFHLKSNDK